MFSHIMLGANDINAAKRFYDAILGELGHEPGEMNAGGRVVYVIKRNVLMLTVPIDGNTVRAGNGSTIGFSAAEQKFVDSWHRTGLLNGGQTIEDPPGLREGAAGQLYLAYLRDPSGNKICAMHRID